MTKVLIEGMMCNNCANHAKKALETLGSDVQVDLENKCATLNTSASYEEITKAIEDVGYEVTGITRD